MANTPLAIGQCATLACVMEATAPKPGNVHRGADFEDASYPDFVVAAIAIGPIIEAAVELPLGQIVLSAVETTRQVVATNTNLGTVLLIAPLAKVPRATPLETGVAKVLSQLTPQDARDVYQAIVRAAPGGLGKAETNDVSGEPPANLVAAMRQAADRDMVARQYASSFHDLLSVVVPQLTELVRAVPLPDAIVRLHLQLMNQFPDSLIARRLGPDLARQAAARAGAVLELLSDGEQAYREGLADLDFWLRADGHRRNPGTTADLIAAALFVALRDGIIPPPYRLAPA
jgi:triphosphoribosyl-dephospho-CoA synthase